MTGDTIACPGNSIIYVVQAAFPSGADPDSVVIQDNQGEAVTVSVHINGTNCPSLCGNGTIDPGEQCDTSNLAGKDCTDFGFTKGSLACSEKCTFDTSGCQ